MRKVAKPLVLAVMLACGCASSAPPRELVDARAAYNRARSGPAAQMDPARFQKATQALERAEAAYRDDHASDETRDLAVIARVMVEVAEARASELIAQHNKAVADAELRSLQQSRITEEQAQAAEQDAMRTRLALEAERQRRLELEKKLQDAMSTLGKMGSLTDSDRGVVITMQGDALFRPGDAKLKADALPKLD